MHNHILKLEPVTGRGTGSTNWELTCVQIIGNVSIFEPITSQHAYWHIIIISTHYTQSSPPNKKRTTIKHVTWTRDEIKTIWTELNIKSGTRRLGRARYQRNTSLNSGTFPTTIFADSSMSCGSTKNKTHSTNHTKSKTLCLVTMPSPSYRLLQSLRMCCPFGWPSNSAVIGNVPGSRS